MLTSKDIGVFIHFLGKHKVAVVFSSFLSISCYILWPLIVSNKKRNNQKKPIGLPNYGNTCFLNSLLQALASCDLFISSMELYNLKENKLLNTLHSILKVLDRHDLQSNRVCPTSILDGLRENNWVISTEQQDTYELFSALMQTLREELKHTEKGWLVSSILNDETSHCSCSSANYAHRIPLHENHNCRVLIPPLGGQMLLATRLFCSSCSHSPSLSLQAEESISLALPQSGSFLSSGSKLEDLLYSFFELEEVEGSRCEACPTGRLSKQTQLLRLPASLCLHIKRTGWLSGLSEPYKRSDNVVFPVMLNMTPYLYFHNYEEHSSITDDKNPTPVDRIPSDCADNDSSNESEMKTNLNNNTTAITSHSEQTPTVSSMASPRSPTYYILKAVIVHLGEPCSGHFTTYRYWHGQWWCMSDNDVHRSSQEEVLGAEAYMLFYERSFIPTVSSNGTKLSVANGYIPSNP